MNWWRASEVGACEVYLWHTKMRHKSLPMGGRVRHMLNDGLNHERDIVERLVRCGFVVRGTCLDCQVELVASRDPYVVGHPDGFIANSQGDADYDYVEDGFDYTCPEYLLEITAPGHFSFLRLQRLHTREVLWQKYVQVQMYLHASKLTSAILIAKNKNTSELYKEGIPFDASVVNETLEKLKRVESMTAEGTVSEFRCNDWRRNYCRYRHLCFAGEEPTALVSGDILRGESLNEAEQLKEAAEVWRKGKLLKLEGEDLIAEVREQFLRVLEEYGARGLTISNISALMIESSSRSTDYASLQQKYPEVYNEVVQVKPTKYIRVSD